MVRSFSNVVGFDDSPFDLEHRGDVRVVGAVCARTRLDGVLSTTVRRDGNNATDRLIELVQASRFCAHIRAVLLQGIALAGFNVVDLERLGAALGIASDLARRFPVGVPRALSPGSTKPIRKWKEERGHDQASQWEPRIRGGSRGDRAPRDGLVHR